jgi:hypothetical protein
MYALIVTVFVASLSLDIIPLEWFSHLKIAGTIGLGKKNPFKISIFRLKSMSRYFGS